MRKRNWPLQTFKHGILTEMLFSWHLFLQKGSPFRIPVFAMQGEKPLNQVSLKFNARYPTIPISSLSNNVK